jgi:hypothetical protein
MPTNGKGINVKLMKSKSNSLKAKERCEAVLSYYSV